MRKLVETFTAVDTGGNKYKIDCYQNFKQVRTLSGPPQLRPGLKEYICGTSPVSYLGNNSFEILSIETEVKKVA